MCVIHPRIFIIIDYRHQEDENVASRGSIAMKTATLKIAPGGDKMRFEVQSSPSRGHRSSGVQKWFMKANHPVEASRWTQAIRKSIELYKREGADSELTQHHPGESQASLFAKSHSQKSSISNIAKRRYDAVVTGNESMTSVVDTGDEDETSLVPPDQGNEEEEAEANDDSSAAESTGRVLPPYETTFDLHGNSTTAQMELTSQLLGNLTLRPPMSSRAQEVKAALTDSFTMVQDMMNEYVQMAKERDEWWRVKLHREQERQAVWEESLQMVVKEGEILEKELRIRSRKRGSRFFDADGGGTIRKKRPTILPTVHYSPLPDESGKEDYFPVTSPVVAPASISVADVGITPTEQDVGPPVPPPAPQSRRQPSISSPITRDQAEDDDTLADTDEEDEFYDAIEANSLPNLAVHEFLVSPFRSAISLPPVAIEQYAGYKCLRDRLPIGNDNRPSTSLWSVLKHSIGKDLTKISFPVFFNEPTSMLQRMVKAFLVIILLFFFG